MSESDSRSQTKPSTPLNTLNSYITTSKPQTVPQVIATSAEIRDRGSTFIALIFSATSPEQAKSHTKYVKNILHGNRKATHEVAAWRCMVVKPGCTGLGGPEEFELVSGSMDDGERWAGDRVLKVMQSLAVVDAVVIVSRCLMEFSCWAVVCIGTLALCCGIPRHRYGGTLLGPSRFDHIETCTTEVCRAFKRSEELRESITTLETLDVLLDGLREELKTLQQAAAKTSLKSESLSSLSSSDQGNPGSGGGEQTEKKKSDYTSIDLTKARRLIKARENALKWVKNSLNEFRSSRGTRNDSS